MRFFFCKSGQERTRGSNDQIIFLLLLKNPVYKRMFNFSYSSLQIYDRLRSSFFFIVVFQRYKYSIGGSVMKTGITKIS